MGAVTQLENMFAVIGPIGDWRVDKVNDMSRMFEDASAFNHPLSSWRVESVKDMKEMFQGAKAFNQDLGLGGSTRSRICAEMFNAPRPSIRTSAGAWTTTWPFATTDDAFDSTRCEWTSRRRHARICWGRGQERGSLLVLVSIICLIVANLRPARRVLLLPGRGPSARARGTRRRRPRRPRPPIRTHCGLEDPAAAGWRQPSPAVRYSGRGAPVRSSISGPQLRPAGRLAWPAGCYGAAIRDLGGETKRALARAFARSKRH